MVMMIIDRGAAGFNGCCHYQSSWISFLVASILIISGPGWFATSFTPVFPTRADPFTGVA